MASNNGQGRPADTAYDAAIATAATASEQERLRDLRLRFNVPPDSPEWVLYSVLAPLVLQAVESRPTGQTTTTQKKNRLGSPSRELLAFALALICFASIAFFVDASSARVNSIALYSAALALGVAGAAAYVLLTGKTAKSR